MNSQFIIMNRQFILLVIFILVFLTQLYRRKVSLPKQRIAAGDLVFDFFKLKADAIIALSILFLALLLNLNVFVLDTSVGPVNIMLIIVVIVDVILTLKQRDEVRDKAIIYGNRLLEVSNIQDVSVYHQDKSLKMVIKRHKGGDEILFVLTSDGEKWQTYFKTRNIPYSMK